MNKLNVVLGLALLSSTAFAAPAKNPASTGQFRRAEAIKAAGADPKTAQVVNLTTSNHRLLAQTNQPANARILFVSDASKKVSIVSAPLDKTQKVSKMKVADVNAAGLVTQAQAKKLASNGNGELGSGKLVVANDGLGAKRGSYTFKQVTPASVTTTSYGYTYEQSDITRAVSVTGKGESATAGKSVQIAASAPAATTTTPAAK